MRTLIARTAGWLLWGLSVAALAGWLVAAVHRGSGVAILISATGVAALVVGPFLRPRRQRF